MGIHRYSIGQKIERFLIVKKGENTNDGHTQWWCLCDCQKDLPKEQQKLVLLSSRQLKTIYKLNNGYMYCKHCPRNTYDLTGEYGIGYTSKGEPFYFDLEDYDKIKNYHWCYSYGYVIEFSMNIRMHRLVLNLVEADSNIKVDHIKHVLHDNRKSQLRIAKHEENMKNHKINNNNKSGCPGVRWHKRDNVWEAYITVNYKQIYLGRSDSYEEMVKIRKEAEEKYFGEWSYDNSMKHGINEN